MRIPDGVIDAAREHLASWLPWAGPAAALALATIVPLVLLPPILWPAARAARRAAGAPWQEQARRRWPLAVSTRLLAMVAAALLCFSAWEMGGPLAATGSRTTAGLGFLVALIASIAAIRLVTARLPGTPMAGPDWLRGHVALWCLMMGHVLIMAAMALVMPLHFGLGVALVLAGGALATTWWLRGGILVLPRLMGALRPADAKLAAQVERAAREQGVRGIMVFELRAPIANAFVVPAPRALVVTGALREVLDAPQLGAILAHEVAHLGESRRRIALFSSRVYAVLPLPLALPLGVQFGVWYSFYAFVPTLVLLMATRRLLRSFEEHADRHGARAQAGEGTYAHALEALHRANLLPAVIGDRRRPHPDLYDRMVAAGVQPQFERPLPPSKWMTRGTLSVGIALFGAAVIATTAGADFAARAAQAGAFDPTWALALGGGDPRVAGLLAEQFEAAGRHDAASDLGRYVAWASPDEPWAALSWACLDAPSEREVARLAAAIEGHLRRQSRQGCWQEAALAELWLLAGDYARASAARDRALALTDRADPDFAWMAAILGRLADGLGEPDRARELLATGLARRAAGAEADDPRLALELADLARRVGDADQAEALERVVEREGALQDRRGELERLRRELAGRR
ncbi:M48 family metalloprotease [Engelhardtia mirabilis]|nr:Protease HtpX [Planctomycetes bacterium Pla86]